MTRKLTPEDFATRAAIDALSTEFTEEVDKVDGLNKNDAEGYTPLCFALSKGVRDDLIVYLIQEKYANISKACGKGTTPLQIAVQSNMIDSVNVLLGTYVIKKDDNGNPILATDDSGNYIPKTDELGNPIYELDAVGKKLPLRDDNDDIVYKYDEHNIPYPAVPTDSDTNAESIVQQQTLCQDCLHEIFKVPPEGDYTKVIYKYDKDGKHQTMKDIKTGKPMKQCNNSYKEINKLDEDGYPIKNRFEYIWDYEYEQEYKLAYEEEKISIKDNISNLKDSDYEKVIKLKIEPPTILSAACTSDANILRAILEHYIDDSDPDNPKLGIVDPTQDGGTDDMFNKQSCQSPLMSAVSMQYLEIINILLDRIAKTKLELENGEIKIIEDKDNLNREAASKAIKYRTQPYEGKSYSSYSSAINLNDTSICELFDQYSTIDTLLDALFLLNATDKINSTIDGHIETEGENNIYNFIDHEYDLQEDEATTKMTLLKYIDLNGPEGFISDGYTATQQLITVEQIIDYECYNAINNMESTFSEEDKNKIKVAAAEGKLTYDESSWYKPDPPEVAEK